MSTNQRRQPTKQRKLQKEKLTPSQLLGRLTNGPIPHLNEGELEQLLLFTQECLLLKDRGQTAIEHVVTRDDVVIDGVSVRAKRARKKADETALVVAVRAALSNPPAGWNVPAGVTPAAVRDIKSVRKIVTVDSEWFSDANHAARAAQNYSALDQISLIHLK